MTIRRNDLSQLTSFIAVAENLSFRGAADKLGITTSALSHSVRELEQSLGVRLLNRTTRNVSLTDAGARLLERVRPAITEVESALRELDEDRREPCGKLRIYATPIAARMLLLPIWQEFLESYPRVQLELELGEAAIDLVGRGFDAGIWPRHRAPLDMIAVRLTAPIPFAAVASPRYLERHPPPQAPGDLGAHAKVQYRRSDVARAIPWHFAKNGVDADVPVDGRVIVNDHDLGIRAALDGLAIAYAPRPCVQPFIDDGRLIAVLEDWSPSTEGFFLYHLSKKHLSATLGAFIEHLKRSRNANRLIPGPTTG